MTDTDTDKRISRPTTLVFNFDVKGLTEAQVQKFRTDLVWHLKGQMEGTMRPLPFDTEIWREIDEAGEGDEVCGDVDETIPPLITGSRWVCKRVKGHDDPQNNGGGHSRGWLVPIDD